MDENIKSIFKTIGLEINQFEELNSMLILRETLLSDNKYDEIKYFIPQLKQKYSSSFMTSLQKNAEKNQKWPLLNLLRQLLHIYGYKMVPVRKSDGYTLEGIKKYKRFFLISKNNLNKINKIKKIDFNYDDNENININKENDY
jgi:phage terminase large subunit